MALLADADGPDFAPKSRAICRLYHHPPQDGTLLCFDEKPGIHVRERKYPDSPLAPGHITLREFEYIRHGTLDLLAAFEVNTGWVFGRCYHWHRAVELVYFLDSLHRALPVEDYGVLNLVSDNAKSRLAPETMAWMETYPGRVVWHFLPKHGSWLNQIEIFLASCNASVWRAARGTISMNSSATSWRTSPPITDGGHIPINGRIRVCRWWPEHHRIIYETRY